VRVEPRGYALGMMPNDLTAISWDGAQGVDSPLPGVVVVL